MEPTKKTQVLSLSYVKVESHRITQIDLRKVSIKGLAGHPYLSYNQSRALCNYYQTHPNMSTIDDLLSIKILDTLTFEKIKPYLILGKAL